MSLTSDTMSSSGGSDDKISIMLVDDSAVIRGGLTRVIDSDPLIDIVSSVSNGEHAVTAARRYKHDVIIMDIEMPVMDGLTALPEVLKASPNSKVIMFSSLTEKGASVTLKAMSLGAVECLVKPASGQDTGEGSDFQRHILTLIKSLYPGKKATSTKSRASVQSSSAAPVPASSKTFSLKNDPGAYKGPPSIIAIGSSTGGPQALFKVIKHFSDFNVPIIVTQHMPATFTKMLATHITQNTSITAHEAEEGMVLENGTVYIAQGGFHMKLVKNENKISITLDDGAPENFCKPAVDPMYRSAIDIFGNRVLGVILTGMGSDGLKGAQMLVDKGGRVIAQDEETSVVWGMPGAVACANICSEVLPISDIGPWVKKAVLGR